MAGSSFFRSGLKRYFKKKLKRIRWLNGPAKMMWLLTALYSSITLIYMFQQSGLVHLVK
jgi:hypothetical protein